MNQFYRAANVVAVNTMDGVGHVYRFTKDPIVHGGKKPGVDALDGLREGTTVVIRYTMSAGQTSADEVDLRDGEELQGAEGLVTNIDRRKQEITIRYANGEIEKLQMISWAAAETEVGSDQSGGGAARIVVYYSEEAGRRIAHYFRKTS